MMRRRDVLALGLAVGALNTAAPRPARAQARYPDHPIRLVVPFPPGGVYDAVGRPWADKMKATLGTIIVENVGGAGGALGAASVARAQPDGYTILLGGGGALVITPVASSRSPYDPIKDFEPIALLVVTGLALVVNPALPVHTLQELTDYAKRNPGKLSYGSAGTGSVNQLTGELYKSLVGAPDIVHVPYKGAGPAITDLISGQIPVATPNITGQIIELHRAGKLRILAVTSARRLQAVPDIPTAAESGLPGMISHNFIGLFAPAGTPRPIIDQIAAASRAAMADAGLQRLLVTSGLEPELDASPEKTRAFLAEDIARWTPIIRRIGLKLD
jgi:tripartite-type tricarboxylate transporter receptor subunit TctC